MVDRSADTGTSHLGFGLRWPPLCEGFETPTWELILLLQQHFQDLWGCGGYQGGPPPLQDATVFEDRCGHPQSLQLLPGPAVGSYRDVLNLMRAL